MAVFMIIVDGISMGSPLGPVLANLLMGYHEKIWLQEFVEGKVLMYNVMLMIFLVCLEMKRMQKIF